MHSPLFMSASASRLELKRLYDNDRAGYQGDRALRILMVHDHGLMREGLCMLIEKRPGMRVVGTAENRVQAFALVRREKPDVVVLQLGMRAGSALRFTRELVASPGSARIIVLASTSDCEAHREAVRRLGADVVLTSQQVDVLLRAIERVSMLEVASMP